VTVVRDTTTSHDISTDAGFRAWASMVHNALAACGLVQTSDTGQINLATVSTPSSNSTYAGYEIWRFNDAEQADAPIFFKIEYGRGGSNTQPNWRWTVGTGSDGAGNITNSPGAIATNASNPTAGTPEFHCCHVNGCLVLADLRSTSGLQVQMYAQIERLRDENGDIITGSSAGFIYWVGAGATQNMRKGGINSQTVGAAMQGVPGGPMPDGRKRVGLVTIGDNNPLIGMVFFKSNEVAAGDTGTIQVYGQSRTYKVLGTAAALSTSPSVTPYASSSIGMVMAILNE
jgi:hypothetical protein